LGKGLFDRRAYEGGFEDSLVRCFWRAMFFDRLGADSFFSEELHGRAEEIMEEPLGVFVEFVEERDRMGIV
jgi:hypothetical protein